MLTRLPLNGLQPRTAREAARDPWDWWDAPPPVPRRDRALGVALAVSIGIAFAVLLVAYFTEA